MGYGLKYCNGHHITTEIAKSRRDVLLDQMVKMIYKLIDVIIKLSINKTATIGLGNHRCKNVLEKIKNVKKRKKRGQNKKRLKTLNKKR